MRDCHVFNSWPCVSISGCSQASLVQGGTSQALFPFSFACFSASSACQASRAGQLRGDVGPKRHRSPAGRGHPEVEGLQLRAALPGPTAEL